MLPFNPLHRSYPHGDDGRTYCVLSEHKSKDVPVLLNIVPRKTANMQMRVALDKGNETKSDISRLISWGKSAGQKRSDNKRRARGEVQRRKQQRRILKAREHSKVHKAVNDNVHIYAAQPKRLSLLRVSSAPVNRPRSCTTFLQYKLPVYKYKCFLFHIVSTKVFSKFGNI